MVHAHVPIVSIFGGKKQPHKRRAAMHCVCLTHFDHYISITFPAICFTVATLWDRSRRVSLRFPHILVSLRCPRPCHWLITCFSFLSFFWMKKKWKSSKNLWCAKTFDWQCACSAVLSLSFACSSGACDVFFPPNVVISSHSPKT